MLRCCNYSFACLSCIRTFVHFSIQLSTFVVLSYSRCELVSLSNKMKDLIFVTCLYFQIMLVQCDIFVNNLNGSNAPIKKCIQKTINHLFSENDTLNLMLNGNDLCEDAIFEMMRPYIVLNMDAINDVNKLQYDGQFITCPKDVNSLSREINNARHIAVINKRRLGNSKVLVITNTTDDDAISWMFTMFWFYGINNVIILVYGHQTSTLFTCNRFAPENECAGTAKVMIRQNCEEQLSLSFTNVIHQMNKCPLTFWVNANTVYRYENYSITHLVQKVVKELSHHLNATYQRTVIHNWQEYDYLSKIKGMIVITLATYKSHDNGELTEPLIIGDVLWLVPKAKQISNMNVCLKVFTYHVWIATSVIFICVALIWCLIISLNGGFTFDKLCISFLNVWSLTIFGNVVQLPRPTSLSLRILLLFYLFYAINMQFAFTSDMSTVLTAPQYDFQIRNLEELADSQLPVYSLSKEKWHYFSENMTDRKLYTKLQNLMHAVPEDYKRYLSHLFDLHLHENFALIILSDIIRETEFAFNKRIKFYKIIDDMITPGYKISLSLFIDDYFTTTLNTFVNRMIESGINEKRKNDFYRNYYVEEVDTTPQDDLITLKHLSFIFVFFGFGLGTACVVFCFELVLHKYL